MHFFQERVPRLANGQNARRRRRRNRLDHEEDEPRPKRPRPQDVGSGRGTGRDPTAWGRETRGRNNLKRTGFPRADGDDGRRDRAGPGHKPVSGEHGTRGVSGDPRAAANVTGKTGGVGDHNLINARAGATTAAKTARVPAAAARDAARPRRNTHLIVGAVLEEHLDFQIVHCARLVASLTMTMLQSSSSSSSMAVALGLAATAAVAVAMLTTMLITVVSRRRVDGGCG